MRQNQLIVSFKTNIGSCILMGKIAFVTIYINHTKLILFSQENHMEEFCIFCTELELLVQIHQIQSLYIFFRIQFPTLKKMRLFCKLYTIYI